ncbi:RICIN domain-containing protein [Micromonospora matsumotoense]|uniref:RICIN domain-containing protein n=1 Tax=Micromonospora matsumotoense TaxID=121616 RepID=UPI0033C67EDB
MNESDPIRPEAASDDVAFVGLMRQLKERSGHTYRQLERIAQRHGDYLPRSTVADVLRRQALPRADVVAAFVRACSDEEDVAAWIRARDRLASVASPSAADGRSNHAAPASPVTPIDEVRRPTTDDQLAEPEKPGPGSFSPGGSTRRPRRPLVLSAVLAALLVTGAGTALTVDGIRRPSDGADRRPVGTSPPTGHSGQLPADGWYQIRPAHIDDQSLCLGEGRERNRRTDRPLAVQRPCGEVAPDTYLAAVNPSGVYEIRWYHPVEGAGCLTVDDAQLGSGALLQPVTCRKAPHQRFLLEGVDQPRLGGYRLRPLHSGLCVGALYGSADTDAGAEINQTSCTGQADQEFLLQPVARAFRTSVLPAGGR